MTSCIKNQNKKRKRRKKKNIFIYNIKYSWEETSFAVLIDPIEHTDDRNKEYNPLGNLIKYQILNTNTWVNV